MFTERRPWSACASLRGRAGAGVLRPPAEPCIELATDWPPLIWATTRITYLLPARCGCTGS